MLKAAKIASNIGQTALATVAQAEFARVQTNTMTFPNANAKLAIVMQILLHRLLAAAQQLANVLQELIIAPNIIARIKNATNAQKILKVAPHTAEMIAVARVAKRAITVQVLIPAKHAQVPWQIVKLAVLLQNAQNVQKNVALPEQN